MQEGVHEGAHADLGLHLMSGGEQATGPDRRIWSSTATRLVNASPARISPSGLSRTSPALT
ncbi:hypothetical protein [Parafrankia discariae]|uniref:hypothetical protein n=1 Tax=Parafrankia discariae TaxID=365528 RepID=UPI00037854BD|nr:hypothetical protein [Parafrankia discariae]